MSEITNDGLKLDPYCEMFIRGDPSLRSMSALSKVGFPAGCCILGWTGVLFHNMRSNRPLYAGAHRYGISTIVALAIGYLGNRFRYAYMSEKDFQYYHYMTLHPEDFQPQERVKYKNYLTTWVPWR